MLKRLSAFLFDFIMRMVCIAGFAVLFSAILGYDAKADRYQEVSDKYEELRETYFEKYDIAYTHEEQEKMSPEEKAAFDERYNSALSEFQNDSEVLNTYAEKTWLEKMTQNLVLLMITLSVLMGYLILEFAVPLFLKNGQSLGKKMFGIGVMRDDGVKITPTMLFVRSILGKCTIEALVPIAIIALVLLGNAGMLGLVALLLLAAFEMFLMVRTDTNSTIHDVLSYSVAVDLASQMIFDTEEDLIAYKNRIHAEAVENAKY